MQNDHSRVEVLEARRLLYGSFVLDSVLYVDGDAGNDVIRVYAEPGSSLMTVEVSTQMTQFFPLSTFERVEIHAFDGDDTVFAEHNNNPTAKPFDIYGNNGNDTVYGSMGFDFIRGGDGRDHIEGRNGDDQIYGDNDSDSVIGGEGNDTIFGNFGGDTLNGGIGDDSVLGGLGLDTVNGEDGNDRLFSGNGTDLVTGGAGNDWVEARGKADTIFGGTGNDTIITGAGADVAYGEDGDDEIWATASPLFTDVLDGGIGFDTYEADTGDILTNFEGPITA